MRAAYEKRPNLANGLSWIEQTCIKKSKDSHARFIKS